MDMHHNKQTRLLFRSELKDFSFDEKRQFLLSVGHEKFELVENFEVITAMTSAIIDGNVEIMYAAPDYLKKELPDYLCDFLQRPLPDFLREHRNYIASHFEVDLNTMVVIAKFKFIDRPSTVTRAESAMLDGRSWAFQVNPGFYDALFGVSIAYTIADVVQQIDDENQRRIKNERLLEIFVKKLIN